jgi:hypothetical protein
LGNSSLTAPVAFTGHWNDHPHPFAWTKDAGEILGRINRAKTKANALIHHQKCPESPSHLAVTQTSSMPLLIVEP